MKWCITAKHQLLSRIVDLKLSVDVHRAFVNQAIQNIRVIKKTAKHNKTKQNLL